MELKFIVNKDSIVKEYLKECGISRAMGRKIKLYGKIYVNDCEVKNYEPVKINDEIRIILDTKIKNSILKADKEIDILYEDEWLLVVNKEPNLAIHPSNKHRDDNLVSRVLGYFSRKCEDANCHILTRLDLATSGIVIIAKSGYVHNLLSKIEIKKIYLAKTSVKMVEDVGKICLPISRDPNSAIKRMVDFNGKNAISIYEFLKCDNEEYIYKVQILTGRTHQIRVHFSYLGSPLVGDVLYFGKDASRLYLHCYMVEFNHPITHEFLKLECVSNDF